MSAGHDDRPPVERWGYTGTEERIYLSVPVTVQPGAVIEHAGPPSEDGFWVPAGDAPVTHLPDNAPPSDQLDEHGHYVLSDEHGDALDTNHAQDGASSAERAIIDSNNSDGGPAPHDEQ